MEYEAKLTGFPKHETKEMIEYLYGVCMWEKLDDDSIVCYPTGKGKVHLTSAMHSDGEGRCGYEDRTWFNKEKPCPKCG